jgi:hypothetical protein
MSWRDKTRDKETLTLESAEGKRLLTSLQNDLRNISNEAKKKKPSIKEVSHLLFTIWLVNHAQF